ncbi:MAG: cytidylate kinase-like family protein [Bacteroidales bacterium]|nr:cytidylate kinase-like family protein [Bacteroidales bacterium]
MKNVATPSENKYRNVFEKYFNSILIDEVPTLTEHGPFISISRDFGCMANNIASRLAKELTKRNKENGSRKEWKWINKSILEESARALELHPSKIEYVFQSQRKTTIDEIVSALSTRYYKSDKKIRKTITGVIRAIAGTGNVIIVGRGGVAFGKDNPDSIHIKLTAPVEWRVDRISQNYNKSRPEALNYLFEIDRERKHLIDSFMGYETDITIFDLVLNRATLSEDEIVLMISNLAQSRGMTSTKIS